MDLSIERTRIPGLLVVRRPVHRDARGWFTESWQDLADAGVAQVSLLREAEVVYGPMPLSAD